MKALFFILLAANLIALVLFQTAGGRGGEPAKGHEPYLAENIKLVSEAELAGEAPTPQPDKSPATEPPVVQAQCQEWGPIAEADAERAKSALQKLQAWDKATPRKLEKSSGFWVYMPPRKTLGEAQKKVEELKSLGVQDSFILQENGSWRYAVSLGVFSSSEAAAKYLAQLREKGVRSAVSGPRTRETANMLYLFKGLDPPLAAEVAKLKQGFPGSDIKDVDCRQETNNSRSG